MQEYKPMVDNAYAAVKDIPQELQIRAFEIILNKLINQQDGIVPVPNTAGTPIVTTPIITNNPPLANGNYLSNGEGLEKLAAEIGVSASALTDLIGVDTGKKEIKLKIHMNCNTDKENHVYASLIYIAAKKYVFGNETADSRELVEIVKVMGLKSLGNFVGSLASMNKQSDKTLFVIGGVPKGKKTYRITEYGTSMAKDFLKKYITGE